MEFFELNKRLVSVSMNVRNVVIILVDGLLWVMIIFLFHGSNCFVIRNTYV